MGALDRFLRRGRQQDGYKPMIKRLEAAMLAACRAAGASAWYVADDYLVLGPELSANPGNPFADTAGITAFTSGVLSIVNGALRSGTVAGSSQPMIANFAIPTTPGKNYKVSVPRALKTGQVGVFNLQASNNSTGSGSFASVTYGVFGAATAGLMELVFTATAATTYVGLRADNGAAGTSADYSEWAGCSVREILSAKNYQDSGGTLPTYFGGTVGIGFDAAGLFGTEKNTLSLSSWTLPAGFTADGSTIVCASASTSLSCYGTLGMASGKAHLITYTISEYSSGSVRPIASSGVVGVVRSANGTYTEIITPSTAAGNFGFQPWTTNFTGKITVNSVREVSGNHVTQATAGNRPLVSRIPRKLGPELIANGDFSGGLEGWIDASTAPSSISVAGGVARFNYTAGSTARLQKQVATQAGKSYQITGSPSANSVYLAVGTQSGGGQNMANAIAGASSVFTATSATTWVNYSSAIDGATIDNTSIREVLEWSYALTFDGSNDSLAAPASVIGATLTQPYTMIQAFRVGQVGVGQRIQGDTGRWAAIGSTNKLVVTHQGSTFVAGVSDTALGELLISEVTWDGTTAKIWKNGVLDGQGALAAPSGVTPSAHNIGQNGGNASYFKGDLVYSCVCPAVMTDAQRLAVRKFAAAQMGLTL